MISCAVTAQRLCFCICKSWFSHDTAQIFGGLNEPCLENCHENQWEGRGPSGRASDSEARGRGFDPHSGHLVVSLSKIHLPPKSTGNTEEAMAPSRHD